MKNDAIFYLFPPDMKVIIPRAFARRSPVTLQLLQVAAEEVLELVAQARPGEFPDFWEAVLGEAL